MRTLRQQPENVQNRLRVLHETQAVAPHPFAAHPRVSLAVSDKIRRALLQLAESKSDQILLARIPMPRPGAASIDDYTPLNSLSLDAFYQRGGD